MQGSLAAGMFGWVAPMTEATPKASMALGTRTTSWAAMLALTVAGMMPAAHASGTAAANNKDEGEKTPPETGKPGEQGQSPLDPAHEVHKFDIPAGTVGDVVQAIRKQAGIRIVLTSDEKMGSISSPGAHGVISVQEALAQALEGTGLAARFDTPDSVMVEMRGNHESVVVTADAVPNIKYTAPLVDLPQTVTVITEDVLQATASTTLVDALRTVPGITFGAGEGGNPLGDRPFIRGLDSQSSTYIDGIRDIASQSRETFDIDSIEVQEGPGGAYGGRGTGGGSINMNSKLARRSNFIAGSFTPGTSNYKRFTVDGNAKLTNWAYGRLVGLFHDQDVAGRDGVHDNRWGFAPSVAIGLGHPTRAFLDYYHVVQNNIPDSGIPYNNPTNTTAPALDAKAGYKQLFSAGDGEPIALPYRTIYYGIVGRDKDREYAKIATGRVERDLWHEHALLRNSFRYERTDQDYLWTLPDDSQGNIYYGLLFRRINSKFNAVFTGDDQTDLSGSAKTGHIKHSYATGFEFSKERSNIDSYTNTSTYLTSATPGTVAGTESCQLGIGALSAYNCTSLYNPSDHDPWAGISAVGISGKTSTNSVTLNHAPTHYSGVTKSVYGFDTLTLSKHFLATVGGRYDNFTGVYSSPTATTAATCATATPCHVVNNLGTFIAGVVYKPDAATSVYATVSTAAIPTGNSLGQGTDTSALTSSTNAQLLPETIREEEFGVKRELAGGKALAKLAVYREDIQNVRITTDSAGDVSNAGTDRTIGLEASISGNVTRNLFLTGGYSFIDARLTASPYAATTGAVGATNGQFMPNTPWSSFSMTGHYTVLKNINVGGGYYAQSMVWGSEANDKWVKGWQRVDLFGDYAVNRHFTFQVNALNVGDKVYYQQAYATHYAVLAPGRTILAGLNFKY